MNVVEPIRDPHDIELISSYLWHWDPKYYLLFSLGIYTGLRVSDILALTIKDVLRDKKIVSYITIREAKTRKHRKIPVTSDLMNALKDALFPYSQWKDLDYPLIPSRKRSGGVAHSIGRNQAYHVLKKASIEAAGIDQGIGTHTMRKTFGYHAYHAKRKDGKGEERDVAALQTVFGHSRPDITLRYIGVGQDEKDALYESVSYGLSRPQVRTGGISKRASYDTQKRGKNSLKKAV